MTTNVIPMFAFNDQQLRGVKIDGEPWFVAKDACACIGLTTYAGASVHLKHLAPDERQTFRYAERHQKTFLEPFFVGGTTVITFISRPGLFKLIQRSSKPGSLYVQSLINGLSRFTRTPPIPVLPLAASNRRPTP